MVDPSLGSVQIAAGSKSLSDLTFSYELKCMSELSQLQTGTVINSFQVFFHDECKDTVISPPYFESVSTLVYEPVWQPVTPATTSLTCGGFSYSIQTPVTDDWPILDLQYGQLFVDPYILPTHVGQWDVQLKACLILTGECRIGPIGTISISDPCGSTEIVAGPIDTVLAAAPFKRAWIDMNVEMGVLWPFSDTIDQKYPEVQNCGPIFYKLLDDLGKAVLPGSYLSLDLDTNVLAIEPTLYDRVGPAQYLLHAYMADYPEIFVDVPFEVSVLACTAVVDPSLVVVSDKAVVWGDLALPYSIGPVMAQYQQKPNCGYDFAW